MEKFYAEAFSLGERVKTWFYLDPLNMTSKQLNLEYISKRIPIFQDRKPIVLISKLSCFQTYCNGSFHITNCDENLIFKLDKIASLKQV